MTKKIGFIILICLIAVAGVILFFNKTKPMLSGTDIVVFYSDNCPHCLNVEKFLEENKVSEKVVYARKSVDNNQSNVRELIAKDKVCGIKEGDQSFGAIPLLWEQETGKCFVGDTNVINFFKEKINPAPFKDN